MSHILEILMKIKLIALSALMAASFGLTACNNHKEEAVENIQDAKEEIHDAKQELTEAAEDGKAQVVAPAVAEVADAEAAATDAETAVATLPSEDELAAQKEAMATADAPDVVIVEEAVVPETETVVAQ